MIAAGEVVERPASVVKELLENSLDAGATEVSVEINGGGIESIRVVDNGTGIPADEVSLAFERYATSKLSSADDLDYIESLGFRGEALPSIAAVSKCALVSRPSSQEAGHRIELEDGSTTSLEPTGAPVGTAITVSRLFGNFPARRRFLRTHGSEASQVHRLVERYALAYPGVRLRFSIDGSESVATSGSGDLRECVAAVYGRRVADEMLALVLGEDGAAVAVDGLIGPPTLARANRGRINLFVNGRWVLSRALSFAVEQAYHGFMAERRFPTAVLRISLPPVEVDVNIHPSKAEVKFRREGTVFSALQSAVRQTLIALMPVPEMVPTWGGGAPVVGRSEGVPMWPSTLASRSAPLTQRAGSEVKPHSESTTPLEPPAGITPSDALPTLRVLGQVHSTYIAAEGPEGIYMVDQHAAHERVLFERVVAQARDASPQVQALLEPAVVHLDPGQAELVEGHGDLFNRLGFQIESFGERAFLVRGVPAALGDGDASQSVVEALDLMADGGGFESWEERAAYSLACHGAIRAGKVLAHDEMEELTRLLEACEQPHTCPHGRPTMVHLSASHLEREFGRR